MVSDFLPQRSQRSQRKKAVTTAFVEQGKSVSCGRVRYSRCFGLYRGDDGNPRGGVDSYTGWRIPIFPVGRGYAPALPLPATNRKKWIAPVRHFLSLCVLCGKYSTGKMGMRPTPGGVRQAEACPPATARLSIQGRKIGVGSGMERNPARFFLTCPYCVPAAEQSENAPR